MSLRSRFATRSRNLPKVTVSGVAGRGLRALPVVAVVGAAVAGTPAANADNKRLNDGVVANVYTIQHQAGCTNDVKINPKLQLAAEWHANDVLNNRALDGDIGSDGSTPQSRANAAGYTGTIAETVAINPALAISGIEIMNNWYYRPDYMAIMSNCANSQMGVWSVNSLDRVGRRCGVRPARLARLNSLRASAQNPSRPSCFGSRCQFFAILTRRSRYTLVPSSFSICVRAAVPTSRSRAPPLPITMPFWLSRST